MTISRNSKKLAVVAFVMLMPWWSSSQPRAESQAKLAISTVVTSSCQLVVRLIKSAVDISNTCKTSGGNTHDEHPAITTGTDLNKTITVTY